MARITEKTIRITPIAGNQPVATVGRNTLIDVNVEELTCFDCGRRDICEYADDPYNTDGDCLWRK